MRFDRLLPRFLLLLAAASILSCKDLLIPTERAAEPNYSVSRILVLEVVGGTETIYIERMDVVVYDDEHPLSEGGLATASLAQPEAAEFRDIEPGRYSIAVINVHNLIGFQALPNLFFHDIELPGDVTLRAEVPALNGSVALPFDLSADPEFEATLRLNWFEQDPRDDRYVSLGFVAPVLGDGSFAARVRPGSYTGLFSLFSSQLDLRTSTGQVEMDSLIAVSVVLPLSESSVGLDVDHPAFPDSAEIHLAIRAGSPYWYGTPTWHEHARYGDFPRTVWLGDALHGVEIFTVSGLLFPKYLWWGSGQAPLQIALTVHRVSILVEAVDQIPAGGIPVEIGRGDDLLPLSTDGGGLALAFLEPDRYWLSIAGSEKEFFVVDADAEITRTFSGVAP